jgi:peptidyl-prolyl cis-trans isomerase SurA
MGHVLKRVVAAAAPCLLLLSGCGVADTEFNPGVAVQVGDETISTERVNELTTQFCDAIEEQVKGQGRKIPLAGLKGAIAGQLALRSAAEQIAEKYGVEPGSDYKSQLIQITQQANDGGYTGDARDAYIEVQATQPLFIDLLTQVGAILLADEGQPDATIDSQQARGQRELTAFTKSEGMTFDPEYGLTVVEGLPKPTSTDVSYAVGDLAKAGRALATATEPDPTYAAALPASGTCG